MKPVDRIAMFTQIKGVELIEGLKLGNLALGHGVNEGEHNTRNSFFFFFL
jgi:hypothetical protein